MMKIRFIKQNLKKVGNLSLIIICLITFCECKNNDNNGFSLQKFNIKDSQLNSIIYNFVDSIERTENFYLFDNVVTMELHHLDSCPAFYFTAAEKEIVSSMYIFDENRRIVGYTNIKNRDVIILTTVNSKFYFEMEFYKFLVPTYQTKQFQFIYFPDDMYCVPDESGIPCPPAFFDPNYKIFLYKDNKFEVYQVSMDY